MKKITTDILIIGSGGAGLRLAIELFEKGKKNILIVGDCKFRDAHTKMAEGGVNAAFGNMDNEPDTPMVHALDTFLEGQNIANPKIVEQLTTNAPDAIKDLIKMGAEFHKEKNGKLSQRYFGAHTYRRTIFKGDQTGAEMMRVLCDQVEKYNIPHIDKLYIIKLLVDRNHIVGVIGIQGKSLVMIEAPVVVLATGGYSNIYNRSSQRNTEGYGDGIAMAFREGVQLGDMEMVQFHPTGLLYPEEVAGELVTEAVRGEGGILTNSLGERFMKKYSPEKMELSTRDVVARSNYMEIIAGRGTKRGGVWLDVSMRSKEYLLERLPGMYKMLKKYNNVDISKEPMEVAPTAHYTMGGIVTNDKDYQTSVDGLYAIGECTVGVHGANRLGGNSLAEIIVFGKLLGEKLAKKSIKKMAISEKMVEEYVTYVQKDLLKNGKLDTKATMQKARDLIWEYAGIVRNEKRLEAGIKALAALKQSVEKNGLKNSTTTFTTILEKTRVYAVLDLGELVMKGALARKESRGGHYREDYPKKNTKYLKNYLFQKKGNIIKMTSQPIPTPSAAMQKALKKFEKTHNYGHVE